MRFVPGWIKRNRLAVALWRMVRDPYLDPMAKVIADAMPKYRRQTIVQIGVNDGARDDPLCALLKSRFLWRALLVEPLPRYFCQLRENYGSSSRFMYEMAAVGTSDGTLPFYYVDESARRCSDWRDYFDRIGSLCREDVLINLGDRAEAMSSFVVATPVQVLSLQALLRKWAIRRVDAIVIDAEGYDWRIVAHALRMGLKPRILMFEHTHLSRTEHEAALRCLGADYKVVSFERDHICVRRATSR